MPNQRVLQNPCGSETSAFRPLSKDEVKSLVATGLQRRVGAVGLDNVAEDLGCTTKTVREALAHNSLLEADKLGNLMARDPSVFAEWFSRLGLRVSFKDTEMTPDMVTISHMAKVISDFSAYLEDGRRDHQETLLLARALRPLIARLEGIVHEADAIAKPRSVA